MTDDPLPPYAFVSPCWPHPRNHAGGHSYGAPEPHAEPLDPARWQASAEHRRSVELFNRGYYWEAHEGWEALWNAAGREGAVAEFLKGLIKLAAAGVKVRQGRPDGVRIHGERALACFGTVRRAAAAGAGAGGSGPDPATSAPSTSNPSAPAWFAGLDLARLEGFARYVVDRAEHLRGDPRLPVEVVFDRALELAPSASGERPL